MYTEFCEQYIIEAKRSMDSATSEKLREVMIRRCIPKITAPAVNEFSSKLTDEIISEDGNPVKLRLTKSTIIAKFLAKISTKIADHASRFRSYRIEVDDAVVGNLDINIDSETEVNIVWMSINSKHQGNGYCQNTMKLLIDTLKNAGFKTITAELVGSSPDIKHICLKFGFVLGEKISDDDVWGGLTRTSLDLDSYNEDEDKEEAFQEAAAKEGVYKLNYLLKDNLQAKYVTPKLSKPRIQDSLIEFVGKFIDDHADQLSTSGPVYMIRFGDEEASFLYNLFGVNGEELLQIFNDMIADTYYGKLSKFIRGWVENAPHKLLITAVLIDAIQNGYDDIIECCEYLWAFSEYPIIFRKYFKTGVKEDVMNYTIEHLGSKFKVKKVSNLRGLLKYDADSSVANFRERLAEGADNVYADFMQRIRNQVKNTIENIARAYYDNIERNATLHNKDSQFDDGTLADQEGHTSNIAQIVDSSVNKFATSSLNPGMVRVVADGAKVDKDNLTGYLNQIFAEKNNKLYKFIEDVITIYFNKYPSNTGITSEFVSFGLTLFRSIATSKDPLYQEVRRILDMWMFEIIDIRQYYQREGTIISYTRAIFNYMIFMINYYN